MTKYVMLRVKIDIIYCSVVEIVKNKFVNSNKQCRIHENFTS